MKEKPFASLPVFLVDDDTSVLHASAAVLRSAGVTAIRMVDDSRELLPAHLLNFALGLVAVFAHGVRLNLLEFSNHVGLEWSGREYVPFARKA